MPRPLRRAAAALLDSGPVLVLAVIAAAGSFTHIHDTAAEHGQPGPMAWAVAVCVDLTCVMAARERQRDKRHGRRRRSPVSWPTLVLAGGVVLSLAANLAQAEPTAWGYLCAGVPAGAFLVAVSMLERRAAHPRPVPVPAERDERDEAAAPVPVQDDATPAVPVLTAHVDDTQDERPGPSPAPVPPEPAPVPAGDGRPEPSRPSHPLLDLARRVAADHQATHGRPITRDALRTRLGVSNALASDLLRQVRTTPDTA